MQLLIGGAAGIVISVLVGFSLIALLVACVMLSASAAAEVQRRLAGVGLLRAIGVSAPALAAAAAIEAVAVTLPAAAFGVALLAVVMRSFIPALAPVLVILSIVLFLVPIFTYRSTGTTSGGWSTREEKRWRGQVIDFNTRREITDDPLAGIKRWFRRR